MHSEVSDKTYFEHASVLAQFLLDLLLSADGPRGLAQTGRDQKGAMHYPETDPRT